MEGWPSFTFQGEGEEDLWLSFAEKTGHITGILKTLPEDMQWEAVVDVMVAEAVKTSAIEGEYMSRADVKSSIRNNLGLNIPAENVGSKMADGIGTVLANVRNTFKDPLTKDLLFKWHKALFAGSTDMPPGAWRSHPEPMQVVSGAIGKQRIHFEAPPSAIVDHEMDAFIRWFNSTAPGEVSEIKKSPLRAAIAHLYFESIHPFEDGNGRIGRAIADKALSQGMGRPSLISLSKAIEANKKEYYAALEAAQKSLDISKWIQWFLWITVEALRMVEADIEFTLRKAKFFHRFGPVLNARQTKVVKRVLEEGSDGFEGGINAGKYGSINKVSKATATRDLQDMLQKGVLLHRGNGAGRSTSYELNI